jgi:hypothetical protein
MVLADAAMDVIHRLRQQGIITTAADLARALNERVVPTPSGKRWHQTSVVRVLLGRFAAAFATIGRNPRLRGAE